MGKDIFYNRDHLPLVMTRRVRNQLGFLELAEPTPVACHVKLDQAQSHREGNSTLVDLDLSQRGEGPYLYQSPWDG